MKQILFENCALYNFEFC